MGNIFTTFDSGRDMTVHRVEGTTLAGDIKRWIEDYYKGSIITLNTLWDFSQADVSGVKSGDIMDIVRLTRKYSGVRKGGRTALVLSSDLEFGLGRMFTSLSAIEEVPLEFGCFRSVEKAEAWFG